MAWLAEQLHARTPPLKFGLYMAASSLNCAPYRGLHTGSLYREEEDARVLASWGIDSLHYDNCGDGNLDMAARSAAMRDALNRTGRPILFLTEIVNAFAAPEPEMPEIANVADQTWLDLCSSRTCQGDPRFHPNGTAQPTGPLWPNCTCWHSVLDNIDHNERWNALTRPGFFAGADYLIVGDHVLSPSEEEAHWALWAVAKSPLIHGGDVRRFSKETLAMVTNPELLAIHQDSLGKAGKKVMSYTTAAGADVGPSNVSKVLVEPCSSANISQRWDVNDASGQIDPGR
jgi:alpha-galactosidase